MANLEDEVKDLRMKNSELVKKVQHLMMTAADRENEKLKLMKENNELRLKLGRYRNKMDSQARALESALQSCSEKALALLVRASSEIANSMEITKIFSAETQEVEVASPRWSTISGTPNGKKDKVHRVPPLMVGGQSIQPVVALSRAVLNTSNPRSTPSTPSQRNVTTRVLPMHTMLQDVYIPLMRIDAEPNSHNMDVEESPEADESVDQIEDESQRISEGDEYDDSRGLEAVAEDIEPGSDHVTSPRSENPLEGPSWLLDSVGQRAEPSLEPNCGRAEPSLEPNCVRAKPGLLEPDSTTEPEHHAHTDNRGFNTKRTSLMSPTFSPTVRRRKRTVSPHCAAPSPQRSAPSTHCAAPSPQRTAPEPHRAAPEPHRAAPEPHSSPTSSPSLKNSTSGRELKVLVAKMRLDGGGGGGGAGGGARTPPAPAVRPSFMKDAPSPNGATVPGLIVSERESPLEECARGTWRGAARDSSPADSRHSGDSGDSERRDNKRTRRTRRQVTYKEIPLNIKMRR